MNDLVPLPPETGDYNDKPLPIGIRWGLGDPITWAWIAAACLLGLTIALTAYVLPMGRVAVVPSIKLY